MARLKITYPSLQQPGRVTFGTGSVRTLAECDALERTAIFLDGAGTVRDVVAGCLAKRGHQIERLSVCTKPPGEPTWEMIQSGAAFLKKVPSGSGGYGRIVGIGGGSVMDWCRLAWAEFHGLLVRGQGQLATPGQDVSRPELWLIPTTCGTGAEATNVAVYSDGGKKVPVVAEWFTADRVVLDGQFLNHAAGGLLECSLADALSHAIEAQVSIVPGQLAKEAGTSALCLALEHYVAVADSCRNERLMEAAYLGGVAAAHCSVGVVHAFAHTVARHGIPHGLGNALGLIPGIRANADVPAMARLLRRCGAAGVEQLIEQVEPIVCKAVSGAEVGGLRALLREDAARAEIRKNMADDVCMRTNPGRLGDEDLNTFLDGVIETAQTA